MSKPNPDDYFGKGDETAAPATAKRKRSINPDDYFGPVPTPAPPPGPTTFERGLAAVKSGATAAADAVVHSGMGLASMARDALAPAAPPADPLSVPAPAGTMPESQSLTERQMLEGEIAPERLDQLRRQQEYQRAAGAGSIQNVAPEVAAGLALRQATGSSAAGAAAQGAAQGLSSLGKVVPGLVAYGADAVGADGVRDFALGAAKRADNFNAAVEGHGDYINQTVGGVFNSVVQSLPTLAFGLGGATEIVAGKAVADVAAKKAAANAMKSLFVQTAGQEYADARNLGFGADESAVRAAIFGAAEVWGERFGFHEPVAILKAALKKDIPTGQLGKVFASGLMKEIPGEELTTAIQFLADKYGPAAQHPGATLQNYLDQARDTAVQTIGQSLVMGAPAGGRQALANADRAIARSAGELPGVEQDRGFGAEDIAAAINESAAAFGVSTKAAAALRERALAMPPDQAVPFVQRALTGLEARGLARKPGAAQAFTAAVQQTAQPATPAGEQPQQAPGAAPNTAPTSAPPTADAADAAAPADDAALGWADEAPTTTPSIMSSVDAAAHDAATSILNTTPEPTDAQKRAGVYRVGRTKIAGLDISIENPQGSTRSGTDPDGNRWATTMTAHYGYIRGTLAGDGDHSDVFIRPGTPEDYAGPVFVIDQIDPKTGKFDEHKSVIGVDSEAAARALYQSNYSKDWQGLGAITRLPMAAFKSWVKDGTKSQPLGEINVSSQQSDVAGAARVPAEPGDGAGADAGGSSGAVRPGADVRPEQPAGRDRPGAGEAGAGGETAAAVDGRAQRANDALTPGQRVTLDGKAYTVKSKTDKVARIEDAAGKVRVIASNSPAWAKLLPESVAPKDTSATATNGDAHDEVSPQPGPGGQRIDQGGATGKPAARPKIRNHPDTVRGSPALAALSKAMGGIGPDLLPDLSLRRMRTRVSSKTGKKSVFTTWDNPAIPGVGPLFRKGGTSDLTELARVLEEAGFIRPGLLAEDYLEARNQAQDIIKAELGQGGSSLRAGDTDSVEAEMRRRSEAAMDAQATREDDDPFAFNTAWASADDLDDVGYSNLTPEVQDATDAILAEVDRLGLDRESLAGDAARMTEGESQEAYHAKLQELVAHALANAGRQVGQAEPGRSRPGAEDRGGDAGQAGRSRGDRADRSDEGVQAEGLTLKAETEADAKAKAAREKDALDQERKNREAEQARLKKEADDREARSRAAATVDDFQLGQSADQQLSGQNDLFGASQSLGDQATATASPAAPKSNQAPRRATSTRMEAGDSEAVRKAKADALKALADLGDILGSGTRMNIVPEQEQKLLPVLTRLMDAAFRLGYLKFKEAAKFALDQIRGALGDEAAGQITLDHLQGAYITMAGSHRDEGVSTKREVIDVEDLADIEAVDLSQDNAATEKEDHVPSADTGVERDRSQPEAGAPALGEPVPAEGRADAGAPAGDRERGGRQGARPASDAGVPADGPAVAGEQGDQPVSGSDAGARPAGSTAGVDDDQRGGGLGDQGVQPDPIAGASPARPAGRGLELARKLTKLSAQREAETVPVKPADAQNIRDTLPFLLPGQQEDVLKAEQRFSKPDGYGMLFTNQPGTGKTFTGLGVIKRFARQGKTNTLIVAPTDKVIEDWIKSGEQLGLTITPLPDVRSAGSGIVITTYANFGQNETLADRQWDLVVHDESHYLMQEQDGTPTNALKALRAITMHPDGAYTRAYMIHRDLAAKVKDLSTQAQELRKIDNDLAQAQARAIEEQLKPLSSELEEKIKDVKAAVMAAQGAPRPRVTFLSATPFAYEKTVDYASGYLFEYGHGQTGQDLASGSGAGHGYNSGDWRQQFFMQHFGYRMRYNKLTEPDAKVDRGLMQRQFNGWLKRAGSLSGRMLDVEPDYDRRFILVDSAIGTRIDEALEWISEQRRGADAGNGYGTLADVLNKRFDYLSRRYLLEAIKASEVLPHVREHLAKGRKVVVFHDYKKGGGFNPFNLNPMSEGGEEGIGAAKAQAFNGALEAFQSQFADLLRFPFSSMPSPIQLFQREFPGVLLFNGDIKPSDRRAAVATFQDDASGPQVILVQSAAGKEGISLHDTTGKHQRVLFNLGQPTQPTTAIQQEGRIYRTGQVTDAIVRYLNTGTNWEKWAFATTIAQRASATENLGMGELARALKDGFIAAFEESGDYPAGHEGEGTGGKERDKAANNAISEYDRARAFYFGTQKKTQANKAKEGKDYFATPEPVGLKLVQWLDLRGGEAALEPSAGHGAIARWFPETTVRTAVEPIGVLRSRLAMVFDGKILGHEFEELHVGANKFDGIALNPPFGLGGSVAIPHLAKAAEHLREGGRLSAIIPTGPAADKKFDKWFYEENTKPSKPLHVDDRLGPIHAGDTLIGGQALSGRKLIVGHIDKHADGRITARPKGEAVKSGVWLQFIDQVQAGPRTETHRPAEDLHLVADIKLPGVTFERAGTGVMTRIVVIDKLAKDQPAPIKVTRDYTGVDDINELFDRLEFADIPRRTKPVEAEPEAPAPRAEVVAARTAEKVEAAKQGQAAMADAGLKMVEHTTGKGKLLKGVVRKDLSMSAAKEIDPFTFKKDGGWFIRDKHVPDMLAKMGGQAGGSLPALSRRPVDQTQSPEFRAWFGDSKVVDAEGKPLVVYHGTTADFSDFKPETGWFTVAPSEASLYGGLGNSGANVMPAYVSIKRPRMIDGDTTSNWRSAVFDALTDGAIDGVIVTKGGKPHWVVPVEPTQVKSAIGNRGTFSPESPNILLSRTSTLEALANQDQKGGAPSFVGQNEAVPANTNAPGRNGAAKGADSGNGSTQRRLTQADFDAFRSFVSQVEALAETHGKLFVRWSPTAERDLKRGAKSRDFVSGTMHGGLSAVEIDARTHPVDIAKALATYGFLRMQDPASRPRVYVGERIGTDSDSQATIKATKVATEVPDEIIRAIDAQADHAMAIADDIERIKSRMGKVSDPSVLASYEADLARKRQQLEAIVSNEPSASGSPDAMALRQSAGDGSGILLSRSSAEAKALAALSQNDALFALPKSGATTVEQIAADNRSGIKVEQVPTINSEQRYDLTLPDGKKARIVVRDPNPYTNTFYGFSYVDGQPAEPLFTRPGDIGEGDGRGDVWVDASALASGSEGRYVYNIAATFAHNTGRVFIGDPNGLSDSAMRRRPEQMLASALKFGTTEHLAPHPRQMAGDAALGIPPLPWTAGDHLGNIRALIDLNVAGLENAGLNEIRYEPSNGNFYDADGNPLTRADIGGLAAVGYGRGALAGGATLARGAVLSAVLREEGGGLEGADGRRDGLLERLVRAAAVHPQATGDLFYSRQDLSPRAGVSLPTLQEMVGKISATWTNGPPVSVVANAESLPPNIVSALRSMNALHEVRALVMPDTGQVYLVADRFDNMDEAQQALFHEVLGHYGLRAVLGDKYGQEMALLRVANPKLKTEAETWMRAYGANEIHARVEQGMDFNAAVREVLHLSVEEALADRAGLNQPLSGWKGFMARLQKALRRIRLHAVADKLEAMTQAETLQLLDRARKVVEGTALTRNELAAGSDTPALSRRRPETVIESARRKAGVAPKANAMGRVRAGFDAAMEMIRNRNDLAAEAWQDFRQGALDQFHGINLAVRRELGGLPVEQDPYIAARLANGGTSSVMRGLLLHGQAVWADNGQHLVKKPGTKGLIDILKPLGNDLNDWFGWMIGNRAARLMTEGRENNFTAEEIRALQSLGEGKRELFTKVATEYAAFKRSVLDVAERAGLIDKAGRAVWDKADYIPFYRQMDERAAFSPTGKRGLAGQSSGVRTLRGGESALGDPMENLLMNFSRLIDASLKNNALAKTINALQGTEVVSPAGMDWKPVVVPRAQVEQMLRNDGMPQELIDIMPPEVFEGMARMWSMAPPADKDVVRVMVGGKPQYHRVNDPLLLKALTSFVPFDFPGLGVARAFKRTLTAMVTATPDFMVRNWIRDSLSVLGSSRDQVRPFDSISGIVRSYRLSEASEAMLFAGASFQSGQVNAADPTATGRAMRRALREKGFSAASIGSFMGSIVDLGARGVERYRRVGESVENANREAVYAATMRAGRGATAAAYEAKDAMDFNLRGSSAAYQILADVLPFFNARTQGMYRLGRADPVRLARYGALLTAATLLLAMANTGADWYEELPDWDKDTFWHFKVAGAHFRVPKPFEIGVVFSTIPERAWRAAFGPDTAGKFASRAWSNLRDQLAFDPIPQVIRPALDAARNKDAFRGSAIENMSDEGKLPSQRYSASTSPTMVGLAGALSPVIDNGWLPEWATFGPKKMEFLLKGYLGTVGGYGLGVVDSLVRATQDGPPRPASRLDDLPLVGSFYREDPARSTVFESDLYELRTKLEQVRKSVTGAMRTGNQDDAAELLERYQTEMQAYGVVEGTAKALMGLRRQRDAIYRDPDLTPEAKRERLDALQEQVNQLAKDAMENELVKPLR